MGTYMNNKGQQQMRIVGIHTDSKTTLAAISGAAKLRADVDRLLTEVERLREVLDMIAKMPSDTPSYGLDVCKSMAKEALSK